MANLSDDTQARRDALTHSTVIAVVGMSDDHYYSSYEVGKYLEGVGYTVYPVNPTIPDIDGAPTYASLADVPEPIDIVDVFRKPMFLAQIVEQAKAAGAKLVWGQLDVHSDDAVSKADSLGIDIVTNRCIMADHKRMLQDTVEG